MQESDYSNEKVYLTRDMLKTLVHFSFFSLFSFNLYFIKTQIYPEYFATTEGKIPKIRKMFSTGNVPQFVYLRIGNCPNPYVYRLGDILIEGHGHFVSFEFENMSIKAHKSWRKSKINKFFR